MSDEQYVDNNDDYEEDDIDYCVYYEGEPCINCGDCDYHNLF